MSASMAEAYGPEEFAVVRPIFLYGRPERVDHNPRENTLEEAEAERQRWIDRGEDAYVVARQWRLV